MGKVLLPLLVLLRIILGPLSVAAQQQDSLVYTVADKAPEFRGNLLIYLRNIRTYKEDLDEGLTGKMVATFMVTKEGKIKEVKLIRAQGSRMEQDFVRLIKAMPDWKPAMLQGRPVAFRYTLPLQLCFRE